MDLDSRKQEQLHPSEWIHTSHKKAVRAFGLEYK